MHGWNMSIPWYFKMLIIAMFGFAAAWWIQGVRITRAEQALTDYKQSIKAQELEHAATANAQREFAEQQFKEEKNELNKQIKAGEAYRRCVAVGKCGARVSGVRDSGSCSSSISLPSSDGVNGASPNAIPTFSGATENESESPNAVVNECAVTTLMLNSLQHSIENQHGY